MMKVETPKADILVRCVIGVQWIPAHPIRRRVKWKAWQDVCHNGLAMTATQFVIAGPEFAVALR
jgi:hypothetical protein